MRRSRIISMILAAVMVLTVGLGAVPSVLAFPDGDRVGVHDPSIIKDSDGTYYVFGSHIAQASSTDLINWTQMGTDEYQDLLGNSATGISPIYGDIQTNLAEAFQWAGYDDGDASNGGYAVWAPDVIWNEDYKWLDENGQETGETGAYMMYYSASSTWRRSCIGFVISRNIEGPYEKPAYGSSVVVSSGFTNSNNLNSVITDGNSTRDTRYTNAHVGTLIAEGKFEISSNWFLSNGATYNTSYAPNAIDPALLSDADGTLWMVYGSWSGGIFMLEIDPSTGQAIYPCEDSTDEHGQEIDRYFGVRVAGQQINTTANNSNSIEGPYIVYDEDTEYYYLFVTYGGLAADGGYNMRQFRSKNANGPYEDAVGNSALFRTAVSESGGAITSDNVNVEVGVRVMANYQFSEMDIGYMSPGHNSVFKDDNGQWYLIYHTRFTEDKWHEVRVHQMFMTEDGWLTTAPYEYLGDTMDEEYTDDEVIDSYEVIIHTKEFGNFVEPSYIVELKADGSITGDLSGTWERGTENNISLEIDGVRYTGVFFKQTDESGENRTDGKLRMTFTAIGDNNQSIWGSTIDWTDEDIGKYILESISLPGETTDDLTLPTTGSQNTSISWSSSDESIILSDGTVTRQNDNVTVTLTATVNINGTVVSREFLVNVIGVSNRFDALYYYDFEDDAVSGTSVSSKGTEDGDATMQITGGDTGSVSLTQDEERGSVLQILNTGTSARTNHLELPSDTFSTVTDGFTISMWVNVDKSVENYFMHSALFEANGGGPGTWKMTRLGANLIGRINANGYADVDPNNPGDNATDNVLASNEWHMVSYTVDTGGLSVYLDGELIGTQSKDLSGCFDASNADSIINSTWVAVGAGDIWSDRDISNALFDDVAVYGHALTSSEMQTLYKSSTMVTYELSFDTNGGKEVEPITEEAGTVIDLSEYTTEKEGYTFEGWYSDETLENEVTSVILESDTIVYAKWSVSTYTVKFDSKEGSAVKLQKVIAGATAVEPKDPTKAGHEFIGWYTDEVTETPYDFNTAVTEDIILYARWVEETASTYTVTFNDGTAEKTQTVVAGETAIEPKDPTKDGYTFIGWYTDESLETLYDFNSQVTKDITLYAKWSANHLPYINGFEDGTFLPDSSITRGQAAQMLYNISEDTTDVISYTNSFDDVSSNSWYYDAIMYLAEKGVVEGYNDGTFVPEAPITRAELTAIVVRFSGLTASGTPSFSDVADTHWAVGHIAVAEVNMLIEGYEDGTFAPDNNMTRAETVKLMNNMLGRDSSTANISELTMPFSDVPEGYWAYAEILEAAVAHVH